MLCENIETGDPLFQSRSVSMSCYECQIHQEACKRAIQGSKQEGKEKPFCVMSFLDYKAKVKTRLLNSCMNGLHYFQHFKKSQDHTGSSVSVFWCQKIYVTLRK